jgi:hypothetical protein
MMKAIQMMFLQIFSDVFFREISAEMNR